MSTLTHDESAGLGAEQQQHMAIRRAAWSQLNARHAAGVLLAALVTAVVDGSVWIDKAVKPGGMFVFDTAAALLLFTLTLLAWAVAVHRASADRLVLRRALLLAILGSAGLTAAVVVPLMSVLGIDRIIWEVMEKKKEMPPAVLVVLGNALQYAAYSFMFVAALEVVRRRATTQTALHDAQHEQAVIARQVLESRLAAMQAQVEPQLLFDTLVSVEALYRIDARRAAACLDRLINYLRVALPRLRESGSTLAAEIELVQAYVEVVHARHDSLPRLSIELADAVGGQRFFPMLLLPIVQRAVRQHDDRLPSALRIAVHRSGGALVVELHIEQFGSCRDDAELARVRERLAGLYGSRGRLDCAELASGAVRFTMCVPAESGGGR